MRSISVPCGTSSTSSSPAIILLLRLFVEADVAGDHLAQKLGTDELADADAGHGGVVGDHRQVALALPHQFVHQRLGRAAAHEAADHQAGPVRDPGDRFLDRCRLHRSSSFRYFIASAGHRSARR